MSYSNLLSNGKIAAQYLPTEAVVTPTLAQVLAAGADGNNLPVVDIASLAIGTNTLPSGNKLSVTGGAVIDKQLTVVPEDAEVTSILQLRNESVANPAYFDVYAAGATGGGLTDGNLMVYGYSNLTPGPTVIRKLINFTNNGSEVNLGDPAVVGGAIVNVEGTLGAGRVFDNRYNVPVESVTAGTGISIGGTASAPIITNTAPNVPLAPVVLSNSLGSPLVQAIITNATPAEERVFAGTTQAALTGQYWLISSKYSIVSTGSSATNVFIDVEYDGNTFGQTLVEVSESTTAQRGTFTLLVLVPAASAPPPAQQQTTMKLRVDTDGALSGTVTATLSMLTYTRLA